MTETEALVAIGKRLQKMRKAAGFTSALAFADYAGIGQSAYTSYEQGRSNMNLLVAVKIADALSCSLDEIAGREVYLSEDVLLQEDILLIKRYHSLNEVGRETVDAVMQVQAPLGENKVQTGLMEA